jgi:hypothetical protein
VPSVKLKLLLPLLKLPPPKLRPLLLPKLKPLLPKPR